MGCMKCGGKVEADQTFCEDCLAEMAKHPVKQDTVVLIPKRKPTAAFKKNHTRRQSPEELIAALEKRCRRLRFALLLAILLLIGMAVYEIVTEREMDFTDFIGQNYHSYDETTAPESDLID